MNSKTYIKIVIIIVLAISALPSLAQEKAKGPERLVTETKPVTAIIKVGQSEVSGVLGVATYTIKAVDPDESFIGALVYELPEDDRRKLAKATGKSLSDIPAKFEQKDVIAGFEKQPKCPDIRLEFSKTKVESGGIEIYFDCFVLILPDTPQEVSKVMCRFAQRVTNGRENRRFDLRINALLNPEK